MTPRRREGAVRPDGSPVRPNEVRGALQGLTLADPVRFATTLSRVLPIEEWTPFDYLARLMRHVAKRIGEGDARIIVSMPPRHGKSEALSFWLVFWLIVLYPEKSTLITSYATSLPVTFVRRIRDLIVEYGDELGVSLVRAHEGDILTSEGGRVWGAGVGKGFNGTGFDLGICDDPIRDWQAAMSEGQLQKTIDWFGSTFLTRQAPGASVVVIMTRWTERDLAGYLEHEGASSWEVIRLPAICEDADDWMGREIGAPLCEERWPLSALATREAEINSARIWAGLYQQRPSVLSGDVFVLDWLRSWSRLPVPEQVIQSWDFSFGSTSSTASFAVGQVWVVSKGNYYLVHQVRGRWKLPEALAQVREIAQHYPMTTATLIEDKAHGGAVLQQLASSLINPVAIDPAVYGSKVARAIAASCVWEAGRVYAPEEAAAPWVAGWKREHKGFPQSSQNDQVDASSQIINYCEAKNANSVWQLYSDRRDAA